MTNHSLKTIKEKKEKLERIKKEVYNIPAPEQINASSDKLKHAQNKLNLLLLQFIYKDVFKKFCITNEKELLSDVNEFNKDVGALLHEIMEKINQYEPELEIKAREEQTNTINQAIKTIGTIDAIINQYRTKVDNTTNHTAHDLLEQLNQHRDTFAENATSDINQAAEHFIQNVSNAINDVKPQLEKDLKLGSYLTNILKQFANAVTKVCTTVVTLGSSSHQGFFTPKRSESVKAAETAEEAIKNDILRPQ